ncbi:hypothetical protein [Paenibacillus tundrae]
MDCRSSHEQQRSGGDGIDSGEAERSRLSPDFPLYEGNSRNPETTSDRKNDPSPERHHAAPTPTSAPVA